MSQLKEAFILLKPGRAPGTPRQARIKAQSISLGRHRKHVPITLPKAPWEKAVAQ